MSRKIIFPIFLVLVVILVVFAFGQNKKAPSSQISPSPTPFVTATPLPTQQDGWKTFTDITQKVSFQYPETLPTTYIRTQTWPPTILVSAGKFSCKESRQTPGQLQVIQKTIGNTMYCIKVTTQGAAGTIYADDTYTFLKSGNLITLQFTIAYPQCDNYPEPKQSACASERQIFDLDALVSQIAQSVSVGSQASTQAKPVVTAPQPKTTVTSPLTVSGTVPLGWMYEGVFPIKLLDAKRNVIAQAQAKEVTPGSWTSGSDVAFTASVNFTTSSPNGFLVLEKDNPSGLPQNSDSFEIPVRF